MFSRLGVFRFEQVYRVLACQSLLKGPLLHSIMDSMCEEVLLMYSLQLSGR